MRRSRNNILLGVIKILEINWGERNRENEKEVKAKAMSFYTPSARH